MDIGVIAEEQNDIDVLYELTCKIIDHHKFTFKKFIGHGCGKLRRKCGAWSKDLVRRGCDCLVVLHDLDRNNEAALKKELHQQIASAGASNCLILIPIREIESWLLCDPNALQRAFNMPIAPKTPTSPEVIEDPKKALRDIVWRECNKHYLNTVHNKRIASHIKIETLAKCPSFLPYPEYITGSVE